MDSNTTIILVKLIKWGVLLISFLAILITCIKPLVLALIEWVKYKHKGKEAEKNHTWEKKWRELERKEQLEDYAYKKKHEYQKELLAYLKDNDPQKYSQKFIDSAERYIKELSDVQQMKK